MTPRKMSADEMTLELDEAVKRVAAWGLVVTAQQVQEALMTSAGLKTPEELREQGWTADVIVHSVNWDLIAGRRSR